MNASKSLRRVHADTDEHGAEPLAYVHELLLLMVITSTFASAMPTTTNDAGAGEPAAIEVITASDKKPVDRSNDGRGDELKRLPVRLSADGTLWIENEALSVTELAERARSRKAVKLLLQVDGAPYPLLLKTLRSLADAGLSADLS